MGALDERPVMGQRIAIRTLHPKQPWILGTAVWVSKLPLSVHYLRDVPRRKVFHRGKRPPKVKIIRESVTALENVRVLRPPSDSLTRQLPEELRLPSEHRARFTPVPESRCINCGSQEVLRISHWRRSAEVCFLCNTVQP
jgi:hypothetical protein